MSTTTEKQIDVNELSEDQLEKLLAKKRRKREI